MNLWKYIFLLSFTLILIVGCSTKTEAPPDVTLSYKEYRETFNDMSANLKIADFEKVEVSDKVNLIAVEKDFSFGKRTFLTLTGEQTNEETQERIIFQNKKSKVIGIVNLIFLEKSVGNNLIYWNSNASDFFDKEKIKQPFDENIIAYKNMLIKITVFPTNKKESDNIDYLYNITKDVTHYLTSKEN